VKAVELIILRPTVPTSSPLCHKPHGAGVYTIKLARRAHDEPAWWANRC